MSTPEDIDMVAHFHAEMEADDAAHAMLLELASSSDEELPRRGGSNPGKSRNKKRDFVAAYSKLVKDYFSGEDSIFSEADFERRFRMKRAVFTRIWTAVEGYPPFVQRRDATGKLGIHPLCRFTACLRYLAYGDAYDREDENLYISETSALCSLE